jgi:kinesin family protein 6/9
VEARKQSRIALLKRSGLKASETEDIVDEEEFQLMKELREAKRSYKNGYEQLQRCKVAATQAQIAAEAAKADFAASFSSWSERQGGSGGGGGGGLGSSNGYDFNKLLGSGQKNSIPGQGFMRNSSLGDTMNMTGTGTGVFGGTSESSQDQLDDQEAFDRLEEERVLANDPDSLAFFHAQKTRRAHLTQNAGTIRQMQKNKRTI